MFSKNNVSQSMIDAAESVLAEGKKLLLEPEDEKKEKKEVKENLKGNQVKLDKNHNGKLDAQDFKLLRMKKEGVLDTIKSGAKKIMDKVAPGDDELLKRLEKETGGKRPNMYNKPKNEEVEPIEELNKDTVYSYAIRANKDQDKQSTITGKAYLANDPKTANKAHHKFTMRAAGLDRAETRLNKEEVEQIDERTLTPGETAEKERIVKGMKKGLAGFKARYGDRAKSVMYATATKQAKNEEVETVEEDIGAMQSVVGENKGKKAIRVDTLKGVTTSNDPEVKNANAHFSGKAATLKAEGKGTDTAVPFVTDSVSPTHREINKVVKPTFKKIKEMLGKTGTSE